MTGSAETGFPDDVALLRRAIELSGKSARRFAVEDLIRDERTVRKWLTGANPLPDVVRDFLMEYVKQASR